MNLHIYKTVDEAITRLAEYFVEKVKIAIAGYNECSVVLSGGSSPKPLYQLLCSEPFRSAIDWSRIYFFFADERYVPFDDPTNNGLMVRNALFEPLQIARQKIFYISTDLKPEQAASEYAERIAGHFKERPIRFDLVLLGLGDDAHTASLFPHTPVLHEEKALVAAVYLEKNQSFRITLTAALINEAHSIAFLVYGGNKAHAVKRVIGQKGSIDEYPAQLIAPEDGSLDWYMDEKAARLLEES
jgi:6-phosphogluconolactonase